MSDEIEPCPQCGRPGIVVRCFGSVKVRCLSCYYSGTSIRVDIDSLAAEKRATALWNEVSKMKRGIK